MGRGEEGRASGSGRLLVQEVFGLQEPCSVPDDQLQGVEDAEGARSGESDDVKGDWADQ